MTKRGLVLSGGGSKGAYQVGCLKALFEAGRKYDVVAGVSVGALNAGHIAMYPPEEQAEKFGELYRIWTESVKGDKSIYKSWAPWILTYLWSFWKGGIYSMEPLRDILVEEVDLCALRNSGVELEVGVVSLQSGNYHSVNLSSDPGNNQLAVDWIWASCIFPVMFPAVEIGGEQWVDGGIRNVIPVMDVLKYEGVTEVDICLTAPRDGGVKLEKDKFKSALDVGLRSASLLSDEVYATDLDAVCDSHNVKLNFYDPKGEVNEDSFTFDPEEILKLIELGYKDTKERLAKEQ